MDNNKPAKNASANTPPKCVVRDGNLKASIWENRSETGSFYSTTFAKTYEDKNGRLQDSTSFSGTDLLRISELARKAYAHTGRLRSEQNAENDQQQSNGRGNRQQSNRGYDRG